ncbi:MAG: NADP oxidoreductase [Kiritimatiellae bacterium]|nr:NADP oxidoreductase [Kiritimatiellia bacterium]
MKKGTPKDKSLRVAIVGSGPASFFSARDLLKAKPKITVDVFEKLYTPYGLVRYGVSPDHQHTKKVIKQFEKIGEHERFHFWGHVNVGKDISIDALRPFYHAIIIATGAEVDQSLVLPGDELSGVHASLAFVSWVNGHPDFVDHHVDCSHPTAVVIGNGNVALDIARLLAKPPQELKRTDIAEPALKALAKSRIQTIYVIGRRGPVQTSFRYPELCEIISLPDWNVEIDPRHLDLNPESLEELNGVLIKQKVHAVFQNLVNRKSVPSNKKIVFRFLQSPVKIKGEKEVEALVLENNILKGRAGKQRPEPTGQTESLPCGLIIKSIGSQGGPFSLLPFNTKTGVIPTHDHRIIDGDKSIPGLYAVGWIAGGAKGLIGHTKRQAKEMVQTLLGDLPSLPSPELDLKNLLSLLQTKHIGVIDFDQWKKIDHEEVRRGLEQGCVRKKFVTQKDFSSFFEKHS